jgi:L-aspartate oxidase
MWGAYGASVELLELRNLVAVGELILMSGLRRQESRGGHFCLDHPGPALNHPRTTVIGSPLVSTGSSAAKKAAKVAGQKAAGPASMLAGNNGVLLRKGSGQLAGKNGQLAGKKGLIERARAREVALRSQKEDLE